MWKCLACTFENHGELSECEICETKRELPEQQPQATSSSSSVAGRSHTRFVGTWVKENGGVCITVRDHEGRIFISLDENVNIVEATLNNQEEICFSWNQFGKTWGPARFSWLDEQTILENQHNIFLRQEEEKLIPLANPVKAAFSQYESYYSLPPPQSSAISEREMMEFKENGFIIVRNAASDEMVSRCRRAILSDIGSQGIPPNYIQQYKSTSFCPNLRSNLEARKPMLEIYRKSSLPGIILDLVGPTYDYLHDCPQIAMIWPQPEKPNERRQIHKHAHIDGIACPSNQLIPGKIHGFSMLCGISLSNQHESFSGSLVVYPKSHLLVNEALNTQWNKQEELDIPESLRKLGPGEWSWNSGNAIPDNVLDDIEPIQVLLNKGDAVIAHHQLAHAVAQNFSDEIRMQLYVRIKHRDYDEVNSLLNLWKDFNVPP